MSNIKPSATHLHVVINNETGKFEVGYYDTYDLNNHPKNRYSNGNQVVKVFLLDEELPVYQTEFCPIAEFSELKDAQDYSFKENLLSTLRTNKPEELEKFVEEAGKIEEENERKYAEEFEQEESMRLAAGTMKADLFRTGRTFLNVSVDDDSSIDLKRIDPDEIYKK